MGERGRRGKTVCLPVPQRGERVPTRDGGIFLPKAGYFDGTNLNAGSRSYWTRETRDCTTMVPASLMVLFQAPHAVTALPFAR